MLNQVQIAGTQARPGLLDKSIAPTFVVMYLSLKSILTLGGLCLSSCRAFQNPIRQPAPDPSLVVADGWYYLYISPTSCLRIVEDDLVSMVADSNFQNIHII